MPTTAVAAFGLVRRAQAMNIDRFRDQQHARQRDQRRPHRPGTRRRLQTLVRRIGAEHSARCGDGAKTLEDGSRRWSVEVLAPCGERASASAGAFLADVAGAGRAGGVLLIAETNLCSSPVPAH